MYPDDLFLAIVGGFFVGLLIFLAITIVVYICSGLAFYKAAEVEGLENKWLAWVPVASNCIMLKLGNKSIKFIWIYVASFVLTFINYFISYDNPLLIILGIGMLVLSIWGLVISIQSFLVIAKKFNMSSAWFIVGLFIIPVLIPAYIILYNKAVKISKGKNQLNE